MKTPILIPPPPPRDPQHIAIQDLQRLAMWMDSAFHIPGLGLRFGLDSLLGLIPGFGDTATSLVSLYILRAAAEYQVPRVTLVRMALNISLDYVLGSIPVVGDLFDAYWKANQRNVALLEEHLLTSSADERRARRADWLFVAVLIFLLVAVLVGSITMTWLALAWIRRHLF